MVLKTYIMEEQTLGIMWPKMKPMIFNNKLADGILCLCVCVCSCVRTHEWAWVCELLYDWLSVRGSETRKKWVGVDIDGHPPVSTTKKVIHLQIESTLFYCSKKVIISTMLSDLNVH